jgi:hypothetical protein
MTGTAPAGLTVLAFVFVLVVLLVRWVTTPVTVRGRHRAPWWRPLRELLPVTGWCWAEGRDTRQAQTDVAGELVCESCGHIVPGGGR